MGNYERYRPTRTNQNEQTDRPTDQQTYLPINRQTLGVTEKLHFQQAGAFYGYYERPTDDDGPTNQLTDGYAGL